MTKFPESTYRVRFMTAVVLAQLLILGLVKFWPVTEQEEIYQDVTISEENVALEDIQITRQESSPPPPPRPIMPEPVPNDEIIEEEIEIEDYNTSDFAESLPVQDAGQIGSEDEITGNPDVAPSVNRIVEFNKPREAVRAGLQARIYVNFLVDKEGNVEEASISRIEIYDEELGRYIEKDKIGYSVTERVLDAAMRWKFRPARVNGEPVRALTTHLFTL